MFKLNSLFKKKKEISQPTLISPKSYKHDIKNLLRENLSTLVVDMFYTDDPLIGMDEAKRARYLKKFADLWKDRDVMERMKWLINKQARLIVNDVKNEFDSSPAAMTINGIAVVKDDIERLAVTYEKELNQNAPVDEAERFKII